MDEFKKDLEDYFCRFTFGQFVTLILLEIVTLFFVFYLGAKYGPDLMGGRRDEVARETVLPNKNPKSVDDIVGKPAVDYTYPEVLTSPDGQKAIRVKPSGMTSEEYERQRMQQAQAPRETVVPEATPTPTPPSPAPAPAEKAPKPEKTVTEKPTPDKDVLKAVEALKKSEEKPAEKPEPTEAEAREEPVEEAPMKEVKEVPAKTEAKKETKPETKGEIKPKGKFSVQVGSYQSEREAATSLGHWKKKGYSAFVAVGQVPDKGTWYRVRIGGFNNRDDAQKYLQKLKEKEKVSALVVLSNS